MAVEVVLKTKMDQADEDLQKMTEAWFEATLSLTTKKENRAHIISQLEPLNLKEKRCKKMLDEEKREKYFNLHQAVVMMPCDETNILRGNGDDYLYPSEKELNNQIRSLHFQTQHGNKTLVEEKQLLKQIKQLEGTREKVIENDATDEDKCFYWRTKYIYDPVKFCRKTEFQDQLIHVDSDGVKKEKQLLSARIKYLKERVKAIDNDISSLEVEVTVANKRRIAAYEVVVDLKLQHDKSNAYLSLMNNTRKHATKKNMVALEELS